MNLDWDMLKFVCETFLLKFIINVMWTNPTNLCYEKYIHKEKQTLQIKTKPTNKHLCKKKMISQQKLWRWRIISQ